MAIMRYWSNPNQLINSLREFNWSAAIAQKRTQQTTDMSDLVKRAVQANTWRGFAGLRPSKIFRPWAVEVFSGSALTELLGIENRTTYDEWLARLAAALERHWKDCGGGQIGCGPKYKLIDLLLKIVCESPVVHDDIWRRLVGLIHVPLDKHVLLGLRSCVRHFPNYGSIGVIPEKPSMNFVKNYEAYTSLQEGIRRLANEAGVPPIALDYLAWDDVY